MNAKDHKRLATVRSQADRLLDPGGQANGQILNIDVLEALLGDVQNIQNNRDPEHLAALIKLDTK